MPAIVSMALLVIFVKGLILWALAIAFRIKGRDRWLFALGLAQAGEFGFVLVSFSVQQSVIPVTIAETLLLVIALSMLITPLLFILYDVLSRRMEEAGIVHETDEIDEQGPVIIAGIGRFGQVVNRLVQANGFKTVVLDNDMETIAVMRRFGFKGFLGDPTRSDILRAAGLSEAKVLVVSLDDPEAAIKLVAYARGQRPDLHIVARARDRNHVYRLYRAGADDIVREMFDSSLRAGRYVLENIGLSEYEAAEAERVFYHHDRDAVRELAELWDPDIPASQNAAYIKRSKELQKELETAFLAREEEASKRA
jgi:CPA2 family monovalent cation:H+ antiporter-2